MNIRGAIVHVMGDLVQSIGVAIAGALIWWKQVTYTRPRPPAFSWLYLDAFPFAFCLPSCLETGASLYPPLAFPCLYLHASLFSLCVAPCLEKR
jgi:hypothetical protein